MLRRTTSVFAALLCALLLFPLEGRAQTALTRAVLEVVRNRVQLLLQDQTRPAQPSDVVTPGDGVATSRDSLAELRFNDGSLGRLGEQAIFWFSPGTRTFELSNGTVLLLIPPGQGRTHIHTPNAAAGIRGSALFVRYIDETNTTIVGALTDSGIEISNQDGSQTQVLRGGQLAVAVDDEIVNIYDFDLNTFYDTSELIRGLAPTDTSSSTVDEAIAAVQAEMRAAVEAQPVMASDEVIENPGFARPPQSPRSTGSGLRQPPGQGTNSVTGVRGGDVYQNQIVQPSRDPRPSRDNGAGPGINRPNPGGPGNNGGRDPDNNGRPGRDNPPGLGGGNPGNGGNNPGVDNGNPGNGGNNPGVDNGNPGNGGNPPGLDGDNPGNGGNPPGLDGDNPGNGGNPPGLDGDNSGNGGNPPGLDGDNSGNGGNPPGLDGDNPGNGGNPPGLDGDNPGNGGNPPGLDGDNPGNGGNPPGLDGDNSGNGGNPPGLDGDNPGNGGNPPGLDGGLDQSVIDSLLNGRTLPNGREDGGSSVDNPTNGTVIDRLLDSLGDSDATQGIRDSLPSRTNE